MSRKFLGVLAYLAGASRPAAAQDAIRCTLLVDAAIGKTLVREGQCEQHVTPASTFQGGDQPDGLRQRHPARRGGAAAALPRGAMSSSRRCRGCWSCFDRACPRVGRAGALWQRKRWSNVRPPPPSTHDAPHNFFLDR